MKNSQKFKHAEITRSTVIIPNGLFKYFAGIFRFKYKTNQFCKMCNDNVTEQVIDRSTGILANTTRGPNAGLMLAQRRRLGGLSDVGHLSLFSDRYMYLSLTWFDRSE